MPSLLAIIAVLFFGALNFSADRSDQHPNTVASMYERSESKLCGKKRAPTFNGCRYVLIWIVTRQIAHSGECGHLIRFNAGSASGALWAVQDQHL